MSFGRRISPLPPEQISPADWQAIITLPVQVGLWMGRLDERGGDRAQQAEHDAMCAFLEMACRKFENIPLINQIAIAAGTVVHGIINPLTNEGLAAKAADVLTCLKKISMGIEVNAYKLLLIEMAEYVARAAPENDYGPQNLMGGPVSGWHGLYPSIMNQTLRRGHGPRVSRIEKEGINRLIDLLDAGNIVQRWETNPMNPRQNQTNSYGSEGRVNHETKRTTP